MFTTKGFKSADIKAAAKSLSIALSENFLENYTDRTRQKHRLLVLDAYGHIDFSSAIATFEEIIIDMVAKQMHPLLESITSASILTWQHVNLHGTYDFSNLLSSNEPHYTLDEMINFKAA